MAFAARFEPKRCARWSNPRGDPFTYAVGGSRRRRCGFSEREKLLEINPAISARPPRA